MAISEATALHRARKTLESFPKGNITSQMARKMFVAMAESQVGYISPRPTFSMYGKAENWPPDSDDWNGRQVNYCVMGGSWSAAWAFGRAAAYAGFGRQYNSPNYPLVGGTWTVWVLDWGRRTGKVVDFNDVRSGDIVLTRWGRTGAEVDHYDIATGPRSLNLIPVVGFNTSSGDASAGAGVYRAWRPRQRVVAVVRPDFDAVARVYNESNQEELMSDAQYKALDEKLERLQRDLTSLRGERTNAHVKTYDLLEKIFARQTNINQSIHKVLGEIRSVPQKVVSYRVPFIKGTSMHKLFGDNFRFGALLGYAGAAFYDRDTHTEEIVDAMDIDQLESEIYDEAVAAQEEAAENE